MARLLIYLSFLSLPGAGELGLLPLTGFYVALVLVAPVVEVALRPGPLRGQARTYPLPSLLYLLLIAVFLLLNFTVAQLNQVEPTVWISRSIHLALVPFFYSSFKVARLDPGTVFKDICLVGFIEVFLVYAVSIAYFGSAPFRRATDFEGVIVYSVFFLFAALFCLRKYEVKSSRFYLFAYFLVLFATILTGTRVLTISVALLILALKHKTHTVIIGAVLAVLVLPLVELGMFDRFNLGVADNLITISSKLEELAALWGLFSNHPVSGAGFGKAYQVSLALTEYTYSHNIVFFYLGYAGLGGLLVGLYPLIRLFLYPRYRVILIAIMVFYTSSTTFTNVRHSIVLAFALLLLDSRGSLTERYSGTARRAVAA